jgi:hypothetical protein
MEADNLREAAFCRLQDRFRVSNVLTSYRRNDHEFPGFPKACETTPSPSRSVEGQERMTIPLRAGAETIRTECSSDV